MRGTTFGLILAMSLSSSLFSVTQNENNTLFSELLRMSTVLYFQFFFSELVPYSIYRVTQNECSTLFSKLISMRAVLCFQSYSDREQYFIFRVTPNECGTLC